MRMLDDNESNDVEVSWSDQQKINQFSRLNGKQSDIINQLKLLREEKEQIDEVFDEVQMLEMSEGFEDDLGGSDEDEEDELEEKKKSSSGGIRSNLIPFKIGDAFAHVTYEKALELLEQDQKRLEGEIEKLEDQSQKSEEEMKGLKVDLYAKFGSNINLERD